MIYIDWTLIEKLWSTSEGKLVFILLILAIIFLLFTHGSKKRDWLADAQKRQQTRFEYLNGKPSTTKTKEQPSKAQQDGYTGKRKWYPTGWTFNEKTGLWEAPDYITKDAHSKWEWDDKKQVWIDTKKKQQMERYKKFREGKEPTYEEWKASQEHPEK